MSMRNKKPVEPTALERYHMVMDLGVALIGNANQAIIEAGLKIAEPYIPEEYKPKYQLAKKLLTNPEAINEEIIKQAEIYVPEEHKEQYRFLT